MRGIKIIVNIISCFCFIPSWRKSLRRFLKCQLGYVLDNRKKEFSDFVKSMSLYNEAPESFSFPKEESPLVSIIVPVYNQYRYTHLCLWSILQNTQDVSYEVILADDCSTDETRTISERIENLRVIKTNTNQRFLKNCNNAARYARGKYILFLNNDTQVQPEWLTSLTDLAEADDSIGMLGSQLIYPDGVLQEAGGIVFNDASGYNYGRCDLPVMEEYCYRKEVDYISGASIMLKRELWNELGGFDERFAPAYYEDTDLAFQVRQRGLKVIYQPKSKVVHFEGRSNGTNISSGQKSFQAVNQKKFYEKWKDVLHRSHGTERDLFLVRDRSWGKKTLLFVDETILTYDNDTGNRASFQYLKFFVDHGLNVKFLSMRKWPMDYHLETIRSMGVEVICLLDQSIEAHENWLKKNGKYIDYIYLNRPSVASKFFKYFKSYTSAKTIYQGHDLHFARLLKQYAVTGDKKIQKEANAMESIEKELIPQMDVITYFSEEEIDDIKKWGVTKPMASIPLFLFDLDSEKRIACRYEASGRADIMFVGGCRHYPNVDAALYLVNEIMPKIWKTIPEIKVHLVGSNPPEELAALSSDKVIVHGFVSDEELELLYSQIKISIIPLRIGAGVKGKILESIYYKVPVVTTSIGVQGIPANACIKVQDTAVALADEIIRLYGDASALARMSKDSECFIAANYSERVALNKFKQWIEID